MAISFSLLKAFLYKKGLSKQLKHKGNTAVTVKELLNR